MVEITRRTAPPHGGKRNYRSHCLLTQFTQPAALDPGGKEKKGQTEESQPFKLNFFKEHLAEKAGLGAQKIKRNMLNWMWHDVIGAYSCLLPYLMSSFISLV